MKIFYHTQTQHLIATPFRNGSSHLYENMMKYQLTDISHLPIFDSIQREVVRRTFLYRDPCLRLISYYHNFVYSYNKPSANVDILRRFKPSSRGYDLFSDMMLAKDNIIKNYREDKHTQPQYDYFVNPDYNQNLDDYEIISVNQYAAWIKLMFKVAVDTKKHPSDDCSIVPSSFRNMQRIQDMCTELYKDDYEKLEPRIRYI